MKPLPFAIVRFFTTRTCLLMLTQEHQCSESPLDEKKTCEKVSSIY